MKTHWTDRLTPTAVLLVSRGWVLDEVARVPNVDEATRLRLVEDLIAYEPPRRHGARNNLFVWFTLLGASMLATELGAPGWWGFVPALLALLWLARVLAVRALRWRLATLLAEPKQ
ncbi:MAG: hypothetical protein LW847_16040 [Burkholderiales bacterium]|jgi:hypothetical protein|nr:hypothetical protein [Burkholderiales bacterium]